MLVGVVSVAAAAGYRGRASRMELLAVLVGTQLPDIVDKPLAWWFTVLPSGRSPTRCFWPCRSHSSSFWWRGTAVGVAFGVGCASHLAGDIYGAVYY